MLQSKIRTPEETKQYLEELKSWLRDVQNVPPEKMDDFFTRRREIYDAVHLKNWGEEYAHIGDFFQDGLSVLLDIGCGTGLELESIYRRFPDVKITGIDLSESMLDQLRKKHGRRNTELIAGDYFQYPFAENHYDAALSFETLHHFPYQKKQEIYNKLYSTIKNGGYYIECDYIACCAEEEAWCLEGYESRRKQSRVPEEELVHIDIPLTLEHQIELMTKAGFQTVDVLYQNGGTAILRAGK